MKAKMQPLEAAGNLSNFERELHSNRVERRACTVKFIEDLSEEKLIAALEAEGSCTQCGRRKKSPLSTYPLAIFADPPRTSSVLQTLNVLVLPIG